MSSLLRLLSLLALLRETALGLPDYQRRIPNGDRVTSPTGEASPGVGHHRPGGGGARNSFGQDFAAAGFEWTQELCEKDSDCDGLTNGQELGDPDCMWEEGDIPQFDVGITHPGVADADRSVVSAKKDDSGLCANFTFDHLPPSHINTSLVMPDYRVPRERTTYVKYAFRLDTGEDSYAVRFAPLVRHPEVVHHMLLYSCQEAPTEFLAPSTRREMPCTDLVYAWAVGGGEQCMPENVGIYLDAARPWYLLDLHYDNPRGLDGIRDDSGLTITSFPTSAASGLYQAAGWFYAAANPRSIEVPRRRRAFEMKAECSFPEMPATGLTVFAYAMHAHTLGRKLWTEVRSSERRSLSTFCPAECEERLFGRCNLCFADEGCCGSQDPSLCSEEGCCSRCSECTGCEGCYPEHERCNPHGFGFRPTTYDLGCDTRFDFDLQEVRPLPEPQTVYPWDTFTTHCVYNSMDRTSTTSGGDATDEEMCMGFFLYYPRVPEMKDCAASAAHAVQLDVGDGEHTCRIPGQAHDESLCGAADLDAEFLYAGFSSLDAWLKIHVVSMQLSLGFLLPVGVLIPMSFREAFKDDGVWFKCHRLINVSGLLIMLVGVAVAFMGMACCHLTELHHRVGVAVSAFALLQPLNAFFRPHHDDTQGCVSRSTWETVHKSLGRLVILGAWFNIFAGVKLLQEIYGTPPSTSTSLIVVQATIIGVLSIVALYRDVKRRLGSKHTNAIDGDREGV